MTHSDLNTIRPCCHSVQLNTLFGLLDRQLAQGFMTSSRSVPVEPEITLSVLLDWLVWEVPNTTLTLTIRCLTPTLVDTITLLMNRDNVSIGRPRTKVLNKLVLTIPRPKKGDAQTQSLLKHLRTFGRDRFSLHYLPEPSDPSTIPPSDTSLDESITLTSDQPRRNRPILISVHGDLAQVIIPKIRKLSFQVSALQQ